MAGESDSEVLPVLLLLHKFCVSNATIYVSYLHCNLHIPKPRSMPRFHASIKWMNGRGCYPIAGAVRATFVDSADAKSSGKLCAFLSCITSIPRFCLFTTSAQVGMTLPFVSTMD